MLVSLHEFFIFTFFITIESEFKYMVLGGIYFAPDIKVTMTVILLVISITKAWKGPHKRNITTQAKLQFS